MDKKEIDMQLAKVHATYGKGDKCNKVTGELQQILSSVSPVLNQRDAFWELAAQGILVSAAVSLLLEGCAAKDFTIESIKRICLGNKDYNSIKNILQARLGEF